MRSPYVATNNLWLLLRKLQIVKGENHTSQLAGVSDFVFRYGCKNWGWERRK